MISMIENLNAYDALNYVKQSYGAQFFTFKNGLSRIVEKLEKNANIQIEVSGTNEEVFANRLVELFEKEFDFPI
mgnify:CR=1 FL=1